MDLFGRILARGSPLWVHIFKSGQKMAEINWDFWKKSSKNQLFLNQFQSDLDENMSAWLPRQCSTKLHSSVLPLNPTIQEITAPIRPKSARFWADRSIFCQKSIFARQIFIKLCTERFFHTLGPHAKFQPNRMGGIGERRFFSTVSKVLNHAPRYPKLGTGPYPASPYFNVLNGTDHLDSCPSSTLSLVSRWLMTTALFCNNAVVINHPFLHSKNTVVIH